jgi:UPF0176 protein
VTDVVTFYRFVPIGAPETLADTLREAAAARSLNGTIVVAREGVNATLTGEQAALTAFTSVLQQDGRFAGLALRWSKSAAEPVFYRLKVQVRDEIVALKRAGVDPSTRTGVHVDAQRWNALLDDPDVLVIDTRNSYEVGVGTFPGAIDPATRSFREFADFAERLDPRCRVAMFCTGGIRCEKASAYLLSRGFAEVYQLEGGILNYLDSVGAANRFVGECFVFDQRVALDSELEQGTHTLCHACRTPLTRADVTTPDYIADRQCPHCAGTHSARQAQAFAERARQARLAAQRGERHVGAAMARSRGTAA